MNVIFGKLLKKDCAEAFNPGKQYFDEDKWPLPEYFGTGWHQVRRIAPSATTTWMVLKDKDGQYIMGENLKGTGTGQNNIEAMVFKDKSSAKSSISATRPFFVWDFDQYLITTGIFLKIDYEKVI